MIGARVFKQQGLFTAMGFVLEVGPLFKNDRQRVSFISRKFNFLHLAITVFDDDGHKVTMWQFVSQKFNFFYVVERYIHG